jgi:rhamnogalacturonyl hydrolase YesR
MKKLTIAFFLLSFFQTNAQLLAPDSTFRLMEKVAGWQLSYWENTGLPQDEKAGWVQAAAYTGLMALNEIANNDKYIKTMYTIGESLNWETGKRKLMADDYCIAQTYSQLGKIYNEEKIIKPFREQADSIGAVSHKESLEWKDDIAEREWAWCDALFMGPPALAYLSWATGDTKYLDLADSLWWKTTDYLFDEAENLYYRDSRYFTQHEANGKKMFWSRGNGWVIAGLVRMLENMPDDYPDKKRFVDLYKKMAVKISSLQHADGTWHTALLDSASYPNKETSGTGFYCYALTWGVNHGLLSFDEYFPTIAKAWNALSNAVHEDGKLGFVQKIGDRPGSADFNSTQSYGVGAFLLAGSQVIQLSIKKSKEFFVALYNETGLTRQEEVVEIPYQQLSAEIQKAGKNIKIINALTNEEISYQLEYKGNVSPQNLLVQINTMPGAKVFVKISKGTPSSFTQKTYCRYVPERKDDFAWENDRIAFRMYGKALEGTSEDAYGLDVWVKRTTRMILNERYKRGEYHIDHGDGLDYYHVGFSLGAGNIAPYINDSIWYSKNYHSYTVLDNGPLRSAFQLKYDEWNVAGKKVKVVKTISLDAGSQLNRVQADFTYTDNSELPVAIGIIKRDELGEEMFSEKNGTMAYWEPQFGNDGITGVGSVFMQPANEMMTKLHLLAISQTKMKQIIYYTGACWNKAGIITSAAAWFSYISSFKERLQHPVIISVQ